MRIAFVLLAAAFAAAAPAADDLRATLFTEVDALLAEARARHADLLSPQAFAEGAEHHRRAEAALAKGRDIKRIQREIDAARTALERALDNARIAAVTFEGALKARNDALRADAPKHAAERFESAERTLLDAAEELEDGDAKDARRGAERAEALYRQAELEAIKGAYLSETRALIAQAEKARVDRRAPQTLEKAKRLLAEAEAALNQNRYDIDRPRDLARQAKYEAKHAIYLARRIDAVRDDRQSLEALILDYERALARTAAALDLVAELDQGPEAVADALVAEIETLKETAATQAADLEALHARMAELAGEREALARREALQRQAERIDRLFDRNEAIVLRRGDEIIVRMVGLNFPVGRADITPDNFRLLSKVRQALAGFERPKLVVEGHTDSFGTDAANLALSRKRAEAVRRYLIENVGLPEADIEAVGYGETRPVANNETPEGRAKNRRIDIVIRPRL